MLRKPIKNLLKNVTKYNYRNTEIFSTQKFQLQPYYNQIRNVFIMKRRHIVPLLKVQKDPQELKLIDKLYQYEVIENTEITNNFMETTMKLLLIKPVEGVGQPGEVVDVQTYYGRNELLLTGLAVYPSPENLKKYENLTSNPDIVIPSSPFVYKTIKLMEATSFFVCMNQEIPWTIEPWHVKIALRRGGFMTPESALTLPAKPITGPDANVDGKEFLVKVKLNNKEEARVRVRIQHVVANEKLMQLSTGKDFKLRPAKPVFEDEAEILAELNDKDETLIRDDDEEE